MSGLPNNVAGLIRHVGCLGAVVLLGLGCKPDRPDPFARWTEGDALFEGDAIFRGGDSAYSVDLGNEDVLWLFGDSFVGPQREPSSRSGLPITRNAIAVQHGRDPGAATLEFSIEAEPFFKHPDDERWFWPGPGVRIYDLSRTISDVDPLVLGLAEIRGAQGGLGFETVGSKFAIIDDPTMPPARWQPVIVDAPANSRGVQVALGAWFAEDQMTYLFAPVEPGDHDVYLARWDDAQLLADRSPKLSWWTGSAWSDDDDGAQPIVRDLQTEFSVHREFSSARSQDNGKLWMISTDGFGGASVVVRTADVPTGPWSKPRQLARPAEASRDGILIYSAKAHPALRVAGMPGTLVTYCTNHTEFATLVGDMALYFPRFLAAR